MAVALKRSVRVAPLGDGAVLLLRQGVSPLRLHIPGVETLRFLEALQAGTTSAELLHAADPQRAAGLSALAFLHREHLLMTPVPVEELPAPEVLDRFDRLLAYFAEYETPGVTRYDYFARLQGSHVLMLGLGSMSSWVLMHLVASAVGQITGVDPDSVALSNLPRQALFPESSVGTSKIDVVAAWRERVSKFTQFEGRCSELASTEDVLQILDSVERPDLVVLTADQPVTYVVEWAAEACAKLGIPLLRVNAAGIGPLYMDKDTACPACETTAAAMTEAGQAFLAYRHGDTWKSSFQSATISTEISLRGTLAAHEALGLLSNAWAPKSRNHKLQITPQLTTAATPMAVHPDCVCAIA
ncbi:ThiF family adenylyltransferase [Streptomyces sp. NPDC051020]|uniref:ThiF family adenylyltransferase n=1 Tax=Streptomyces sp. NPDC051020 TaxID=3155409 RepID=UPI003418D566